MTIEKLVPEVKEKWVKALRSGDYEQGTDHLVKDGKFCCMGVLADVYAKEHGDKWVGNHTDAQYLLDDPLEETDVVPPRVASWAFGKSIDWRTPLYLKADTSEGKGRTVEVAVLNDVEEWSFDQLADEIEKQM